MSEMRFLFYSFCGYCLRVIKFSVQPKFTQHLVNFWLIAYNALRSVRCNVDNHAFKVGSDT